MNYFVTGATGLVGQQLVAELLARDEESVVHALVRQSSLDRLGRLIAQRWAAQRVVPVVGDLSAPSCGISAPLPPIDHFFHVGASYDIALDERTAFRNNVLGTIHAVQLANELGVEGFHYTSSVGVAGRYAGVFTEKMADEGQRIDNWYFASKLQAEMVIRSTAKVPYAIYRLAAVVGDSETGRMTKVDGPYYFFPLVKALAKLPAWLRIPGPAGGYAHLVPVDYAAAAVCHIAHLPMPQIAGEVFHIADPAPVRVGEAIRAGIASQGGPRLQPLVPLAATRRLSRASRLLPFSGAIRTRVLEKVRMPEEMLSWRDFDAEFDTTQTRIALRGTGLSCPPFESYVGTLLEYWRRHLDPAPTSARLDRQLAGRTVLLTGASRGVGRATATALSQCDCALLLVARSADDLDIVASELDGCAARVVTIPCDLTDRTQVNELADHVTATWGGADVVINNAGKSIRRGIEHAGKTLYDYDRTMALNYFAPVLLTLRLLPGMRRNQFGRIVNVSSIGLQASMSRFGAYNASKAALDAFVRSTAPEVWDDGVRMTTVYLPLVRTAMAAPTTAFERLPSISSDDAAALVVKALTGHRARVSTPLGTFAMTGELVVPRFMRRLMRAEYAHLPESAASLRAASVLGLDPGRAAVEDPLPRDERSPRQSDTVHGDGDCRPVANSMAGR